MLLAHASATIPEPAVSRPKPASWAASSPAALLAAYQEHLRRSGGRPPAYSSAARAFFARWPDPASWAREPLAVRLSANDPTRPLITFLMLIGVLHPGYDYLLERKLSSLWRELPASWFGSDLARFL